MRNCRYNRPLERGMLSALHRLFRLPLYMTRTAYHCLSPAELQRKQQKRRRRARLKQLADQQAAKQMRRRTISSKKQRHTHGDVRKKSAANRRHSADRASSWVNSLQDSQLAAM